MTLYKIVSKTLSTLIVSAILMATPLMAKDKSKMIHLNDTAINGIVLEQGDYKVKFSTSEDGEAIISKNGKIILKAPYKVVALPEKADGGGIYYRTNSEGVRELTRLVFDGYRVAIVFE